MDVCVNLRWFIDPGQVVLVNNMLGDEVKKSKRRDKGSGETEHDDQGEDYQHSSIMFPEAEFVGNGLLNCFRICSSL